MHVVSALSMWVYYNLNYVSQHALGVSEAAERYYLISIVPAAVFEDIFLAINKQQVSDIFTSYENLANESKLFATGSHLTDITIKKNIIK